MRKSKRERQLQAQAAMQWCADVQARTADWRRACAESNKAIGVNKLRALVAEDQAIRRQCEAWRGPWARGLLRH